MPPAELNSLALVAPCGLNCRVCRAHLRERNPCPGCRSDDGSKPPGRVACQIKQCSELTQIDGYSWCSGDACLCQPMQRLERRYTTKYGVSPMENLEKIQTTGLRQFVASEDERWVCPHCGSGLCMHQPGCPGCGHPWRSSSQ